MRYVFLLITCFVFVVYAQNDVYADCYFTPTKASGTATAGVAHFHQRGEHTYVNATITGLPSKTSHGFHVHQHGDISSDDGTATGGHWNPRGVDHACPGTAARHIGDLGNIVANDDGVAIYTHRFRVDELPLTGENGIIGRGMIVHHDIDDCETQPTGNAGSRL